MRHLVWAISFALAWISVATSSSAADLVFNRDIRPILSNNCFYCHGPDPEQRKGGTDGLRLDTPEGALADLGGYAAIVAGHPEKSSLVERIHATDPEERMPPASTGKKLTPREIELLTEWVRQGGKYSAHWSYVKPTRPEVPQVKDAAWPRNDIDRFLLARLEREGLRPSPEADRYALIRRVSLDLTGLPPTLAEVDEFVKDKDPQAYEKLVDRLLAKPTYGEHWAHMWLDLARYADSTGYADDQPRTIWLFRDYVIKAMNANMPFDQFTIEQLAGDLLPNPTEDQLIATAFHRNTLTNNEGGTNDEEYRNVAVVDRVNTTMAVWMGTTIACAQCHNHKYDPISQEEFFRFFAILNNTEDADRRDDSPLLSLYTPEARRKRTDWQAEIAKLEPTLKQTTPAINASQARWQQEFPLDLKWQTLKSAFKSREGLAAKIADDGSVLVLKSAQGDVYTIDAPIEGRQIRALRLEALPDDALPAKGPGHADGKFLLARVSAALMPAENAPLAGRYVRIELPGKQQILSLAEVQVFAGPTNVTFRTQAKQSSTAFEGEAGRAIDGKTDGRYDVAKSTTHTALSDDPWWEVDLIQEQPLDRVVIWNRTDAGVGSRLKDFRVVVLNAKREPVWQQMVATPPSPSATFNLSGRREIEFSAAVADYSLAGSEAELVLKNKDIRQTGWSTGGQTGRPHALALVLKTPLDATAGTRLSLTLEHATQRDKNTLGKFRLSISDDARAELWGSTPLPVISALAKPADKRSAQEQKLIDQHYLSIAPQLEPTRKTLAGLKKQLDDLKPNTVPICRELAADKRRVTKIQHRGNFLDLGKEVTVGTPSVFPAPPSNAPLNRLTLAKWLMDEQNPLTARVIANRVWEEIFGIGIVATSEEFGAQGDQPLHPELLDWLATELHRQHWDLKVFIRLLVTSAAYRQSSRVEPAMQQRDPDNRLLARGPRFRLSAEMVRDQALLAAGLLSAKMYGPSVKPLQPALNLTAAFGGGIDWQTSDGEDRYRRALYTSYRRSSPYPAMTTFDAPNREVCTVRRGRTNTPLQALVTLNDPVFVEAAQSLARRIVADGGTTPEARVTYGFRRCLARPPHPDELDRLVKLYGQALAMFKARPEDARRMATEPLGSTSAATDFSELAAWTVVGNVLLNLDEMLMKR